MSDLVMALEAMKTQIAVALSGFTGAGQPKGVIFRGWPTSTELARVISQDNQQTQVTLWPLKGRRATRYIDLDELTAVTPPAPTLRATISPDFTMLTISAVPTAGDTIHAFYGYPPSDAWYGPATGNETTAQVAAAVAGAVNAPGVSAIASGSDIVLTGAFWAYANIGGLGTMQLEVAREARAVQCSVWAPNAATRESVGTAIIAGVGTADQPRLTMADGTILYCVYDSDRWDDKAESSYSTLRWDIFFDIEYPITRTINLAQVEGFIVSQMINDVDLPVQHFGR